ncbi:MAG: hypothetical protein J1E97_08790 [Muribaculaceae bacterium]|nr:hypothetical protein [Muribaculaceae bacterium]
MLENLKEVLQSVNAEGINLLAKTMAQVEGAFKKMIAPSVPSTVLLPLFEPVFQRWAKNRGKTYSGRMGLELLALANEAGLFQIVMGSEHEMEEVQIAIKEFYDSKKHEARLFILPTKSYLGIGNAGSGLNMIYVQWSPQAKTWMWIEGSYVFNDKELMIKNITIDFNDDIPEHLLVFA